MAKDPPRIDLTPRQQEALLSTASKKLGMDRAQLERAVKDGNFEQLQRRAGPELSRCLSDPKALEALLSTPEAQAALKKLMGGR